MAVDPGNELELVGDGEVFQPHVPLRGKAEAVAQALARGATIAEAADAAGAGAELALGIVNRRETAQRVVFLVKQGIQAESGRALDTVRSLLAASSERVRLEAALALLDRAGVGREVESAQPVSVFIDLSNR